jgi:hypothetical protein
MKKTKVFSFFSSLLILLLLDVAVYGNLPPETKGWKAGAASSVITPSEPVWMAGYASRTHPSEGTLFDIWAKALSESRC